MEKVRITEASALCQARNKERMKWEGVVADKDAKLAHKDAENERLCAEVEELRARLKG